MVRSGSPARLVLVVCPPDCGDAAAQLIARLPADFPAPIIVAPGAHGAPESLADAIRSRSALQVRAVRDRAQLRPAVVLVVPGEETAEVDDDEIRSTARRSRRAGSHDHLITSAARSCGERLLAVLLPGIDAKTATLARQVKDAGGKILVVAADAGNHGERLPLVPTAVDATGDFDQIVRVLQELVARPTQQASSSPSHDPEERLIETLHHDLLARGAVQPGAYPRSILTEHIWRQAILAGKSTLDDYAAYVETHPDEYARLVKVNTLLTNVTEFFRDPELFGYLADRVLPELIGRARGREHELRLWSAGCATGEEAYSLAILLAEALGEELGRFNVRIFATDLDEDAIQFARRGLYPQAVLAGVAPERLARFFVRADGAYEVSKPIRSLIIFGQHDLGQRAPFPRIDLVLCRNVLIYFTPELQRRALQLFAFSLRDAGYLVLGKAENVAPPQELFTQYDERLQIYQRHGEQIVIPPFRPSGAQRASVRPPRVSIPNLPNQPAKHPVLDARPEVVLEHLPAGVVVVDHRYHIRSINRAARHLLRIHSATTDEDLIHLVDRIDSLRLRAAIDQAFRGVPVTHLHEEDPTLHTDSTARDLQITCVPSNDDSARPNFVMVFVNDVTQIVRQRVAAEQALAQRHVEAQQLEQFRRDAEESNAKLLAANEQLSLVNLELMSANEELEVERQEALTAMEEVETLNEELQAANEELEALNEEQRVTVLQLNQANVALDQRTRELERLTESLDRQRQASEAERARLSAILLSVGDPVVVVDAAGTPVLTNPAYDRMFGRGGLPFLALDASGRLLPAEEHPLHRAARGDSFVLEFTTVAPDGSRRRCEATGEPVPDGTGERGVVVIRDVTERSIYRLQDEFLALASHELRTPLSAVLIYLELLEQRSQGRPELEELHRFAERALHQAQRLKDLTGDLLDATRLQHGKLALRMRTVDLGEIVGRAVEAAQAVARVPEIRLTRPQEAISIHTDPSRIEQVVLNLLINALTHAQGSREVLVRV